MSGLSLHVIAHLYGGYDSKFAVPRQSGLTEDVVSRIVFDEPYRDENAVRGIEGYSHLWLLWGFSLNEARGKWSPTVRPPRLGGNKRMGVFATRSPNRPNPIGLSCVRLVGVEKTANEGTVLRVAGADLVNGTPIYDIKPYLPFTDSHPDAEGGFAAEVFDKALKVQYEKAVSDAFSPAFLEGLTGILAQDPRPSYQHDPKRIYGFSYAGKNVSFRVVGDTLTVLDVR